MGHNSGLSPSINILAKVVSLGTVLLLFPLSLSLSLLLLLLLLLPVLFRCEYVIAKEHEPDREPSDNFSETTHEIFNDVHSGTAVNEGTEIGLASSGRSNVTP